MRDCGGFGLGGGRGTRGGGRGRGGRGGICGREKGGKLKSREAKTLDTPRLVSFQVMFSTRTRASTADKEIYHC